MIDPTMRIQSTLSHPTLTRRTALLQAGGIGLLGLGMNHLSALRTAQGANDNPRLRSTGAVIYIFLSGGLAQQDSFDPKPEASENVRGEFKPIATKTPGIRIWSICQCWPSVATCGHWFDR